LGKNFSTLPTGAAFGGGSPLKGPITALERALIQQTLEDLQRWFGGIAVVERQVEMGVFIPLKTFALILKAYRTN